MIRIFFAALALAFCALLIAGVLAQPAHSEARGFAKFQFPPKVTKQPRMISQQCGVDGIVEDVLASRYEERRVKTLYGKNGARYDFWESRKTWTITLNQNKRTCLMASGTFSAVGDNL